MSVYLRGLCSCLFAGCQGIRNPWSASSSHLQPAAYGIAKAAVLLVMIGSILLSGTVQAANVIERPNYGILFEPAGSMQAAYNKWSHTFQLTMPSRLHVQDTVVSCPDKQGTSRHPCSTFVRALRRAHAIRIRTAHSLNSLRDEIISLIPRKRLPSSQSKSKRSLLPFIGEISRSLFGTATEEEVNTLAKHIVALEKSLQRFS